MRALGDSITSTMIATQGGQPAGNWDCAPRRRLRGGFPRIQSAETSILAPPIKRADTSTALTQSGTARKARMSPEVGIGCLATRGVPEVTRVLGEAREGAGLGRGGAEAPSSWDLSPRCGWTPEARWRAPVPVRRGTAARASGTSFSRESPRPHGCRFSPRTDAEERGGNRCLSLLGVSELRH